MLFDKLETLYLQILQSVIPKNFNPWLPLITWLLMGSQPSNHTVFFSNCLVSSHDMTLSPSYRVILPLDCKITWKVKNAGKESDCYSSRL